MNLDKRISELPSVQTASFTTSNGCKVQLRFRAQCDPHIHTEVAQMLLAAFARKRSNDHETSRMSVQSFYERTS